MTPQQPSLVDRDRFMKSASSWDPPVTVGLADIVGFKEVNDAFGREVGDRVIKVVYDGLRDANLSASSTVARVGGDEFACALPGVGPEQALIQLDRVREDLEKRGFRAGKQAIPIRLSIGIASWPQHTEEPEDLILVADEALQRAKREGGNRVAIYIEDKMVLKSNYYSRAQLSRLQSLSKSFGKTEALLLREALGDLLEKYSRQI